LREERRIFNISIIFYIFFSKVISSSNLSFLLISFLLKLFSELKQDLSLESSMLLDFDVIWDFKMGIRVKLYSDIKMVFNWLKLSLGAFCKGIDFLRSLLGVWEVVIGLMFNCVFLIGFGGLIESDWEGKELVIFLVSLLVLPERRGPVCLFMVTAPLK